MNLTANMNSKHTIIVHFAIDNNIDYDFENDDAIISNYLATLESVKANDTNDMLNIIVYMDGCQSYDGYTSPFAYGYYVLSGGDFADDLVKPISEVNSGSLTEAESHQHPRRNVLTRALGVPEYLQPDILTIPVAK